VITLSVGAGIGGILRGVGGGGGAATVLSGFADP
jgi:hypothetical protein